MNAPVTGFNRVAGHFGDLNSQSLRYEIETLRDLVKVLAPIAEIFSGLMGSTIGSARSSASSMLFPLIVGGMLASDVVNNPASRMAGGHGVNHSPLDSLKGYKQGIERIKEDALEVVRAEGYEVKKAPPEPKNNVEKLTALQEAENAAVRANTNGKQEVLDDMKQAAKLLEVTVTEGTSKSGKLGNKEIEVEVRNRLNELDNDVMRSRLQLVKEQSRLFSPGSKWAKTDAAIAEREANIIRNTVQALYEKSKKDKDLKNFDLNRAEQMGRHLATLEREIGVNLYNRDNHINPKYVGNKRFQDAINIAEIRQDVLLRELKLSPDQTMAKLKV